MNSVRLGSLVSVALCSTLVALMLVGCGPKNDSGVHDDPTTTNNGEMDPDGVLRIGTYLDNIGGTTFDPAESLIISSEQWMKHVYGTLVRLQTDGTYEPYFAESWEILDPRTLRVTLRKGIEFSDGATYDAEAVRDGMLRTANEASGPARAGQNALFRKLTDIVVEGPLQLRFELDSDFAGDFLQVLGGREAMIPSPQADPDELTTKPVGAGPFLLVEHRGRTRLVMRANPNYFRAEEIKLGGLEFVHTPERAGRIIALLTGEVDKITGLEAPEGPRLTSRGFTVERITPDYSYVYFQICSTKPPLDDVRVRQALQLGFDRDVINQLWLEGQGEPAAGFWPKEHPNYNPKVENHVRYDPEAARKLIEEAGFVGGVIDMYWPSNNAYEVLAEVLQFQAKRFGVELNIIRSDDVVSQFILPERNGMLLIPGSRPGTDKYLRSFARDGMQNLCSADSSKIVEMVEAIGPLDPTSEQAAEAYRRVELEIAKHAWQVPLVYNPRVDAWNSRRVGGEMRFSGQQLTSDVDHVFVRRR